MKRLSFNWLTAVLAMAMLAFASSAMATNKPTTPPATPTPDITVGINPSAEANAAALAAAKAQAAANAAANSSSNGVGIGGGGTGGDADASARGGTSSLTDASSSRMYVFPQPVWATVPQAAGCIVTQARSAGLGWNFISAAKSDQFSDPVCVGVIMARSAYANCHFLSESMIMQRVYETIFPGAPALPIGADLRNLSLDECETLKKPKLVMTQTIVAPPTAVAAAPAPAPVATVACPQPQKPAQRRVVKPKQPVLTCPVPLVPVK